MRRRFSVAFWLLTLLCAASALVAQPQDPANSPSEDAETAARADDEARVATLSGLLESISAIEAEISKAESLYRDVETDEQKESISSQIEVLQSRIEDLESDFSLLATGVDASTFFEAESQEFDWQEELQAIFAPIIAELKQASSRPREIEALRAELVSCDRRLPLAEGAVTSLGRLDGIGGETTVQLKLAELEEQWTRQRDEVAAHCESTRHQLAEKEQERVGLGHATADILRIFFKKRLINLVFALLAFFGIFLGLRSLHRLVHRLLPRGGSNSRQLAVRLADVAYYLFTVVLAIAALLVVLYLSADWVLLTLAVLVLVALAWAARTAIPHFLDQAKLLLNVGAVREGERVIYNGIPWQVGTLSLFSELHNPELRGGTCRLPLEDLVGLRSRLAEDDEPWFPSRLKDWVILSDGIYGEVVEQTPEVVVVSTVRGSYKSYPTADYLHQHPQNLSINFFSVNHTVSLDYRYRDIFNTEIVTKMKAVIEEGFRAQFYGEHLVQVIVELKEMGSSSLDAISIVKFKGAAASEYFEIGWKLQQLALEACNQYGWEIPFPQLTLHGTRAALDAPEPTDTKAK